MLKRSLLIILFGLSFMLSACAQEQEGTHEFMLDNGLKLIVRQDHRAPVVVSQVWYKIGGSYEHMGITGVSHILEHMMFKGTKKHGPGEFSKIISANGGRENAFTGEDYTAYFQHLAKDRLPISFELEADRMRNLLLTEDEFVKENKVVMEERRLRTEDKPKSLTYERFSALAYQTSPYRNPVIGWMNDLENMKVTDLQHWYENWYAPNNATVVVTGDVEPEKVFALAKKYFGGLKRVDTAKVAPQVEIEQKGEQRSVVRVPAELSYLIMGFKVPSLETSKEKWEPYALEMLTGILDGGASARFARDMVRGSQIAASAGASYDLYARLGTLMIFDATPSKGHDVAEMEQAILAQIKQLKEAPVDASELRRVKAQVVASNVYQRDSVFYQGMQIGMLETVGLGWATMDDYVDRIKAVTAEQVMQVAKKYLVRDHMTVTTLDPLPMDANTPKKAFSGGHHGH